MKTKVVIFTPLGARVLTNPEPNQYKDLNHLVNPDLSKVAKVAPHLWVRSGDLVTHRTGLSAAAVTTAKKARRRLLPLVLAISFAMHLITLVILIKTRSI